MSKANSPSKIAPKAFVKELVKNGLGPVIEVPCSYLKDFLNYLKDNSDAIQVINPVNEAIVMGIAAGEYLGSGKLPVIAIQNSGLMNTFNALTSLDQIYNIPVFMMVTWRGEGGIGFDAPEHDITGEKLLEILQTFNLPYEIADGNRYKNQVKELKEIALRTQKPVVLVIKKNTFAPYETKNKKDRGMYEMNRSDALTIIKSESRDKALFISSTGFTTRDSFAAMDTPDFYIVGSMGHTFSIALGVSPNTNKKVVVLDGDGSFLMHLGGLASFDQAKHKNIIYIVIDNESYESTGGQPTASGKVNFKKLSEAFGFRNFYYTDKKSELTEIAKNVFNTDGASFVHVRIRKEEGKASKRVSDVYTCPQIKDRFMENIRK